MKFRVNPPASKKRVSILPIINNVIADIVKKGGKDPQPLGLTWFLLRPSAFLTLLRYFYDMPSDNFGTQVGVVKL